MNPVISIQPHEDSGYVVAMVDSQGHRFISQNIFENVEAARRCVGTMRMDCARAKVVITEQEVPEEAPVVGVGDDTENDIPNFVAMTVPELDGFADDHNIEDYPKSDNKPKKIIFLDEWFDANVDDEDEDTDSA